MRHAIETPGDFSELEGERCRNRNAVGRDSIAISAYRLPGTIANPSSDRRECTSRRQEWKLAPAAFEVALAPTRMRIAPSGSSGRTDRFGYGRTDRNRGHTEN
jgi:hypothetical protein